MEIHQKENTGLRLGQRFHLMYMRNPWPELFYGADEITGPMIRSWLNDHHYLDTLPEPYSKNPR